MKACAKCMATATLVLTDGVFEWIYCTCHAADALSGSLAGRIRYIYAANGVARVDLPADALALVRTT